MLIHTAKFSTLEELRDAVMETIVVVNGPTAATRVHPSEVYASTSKIEYEIRLVDEKLSDGSRVFNFFIVDPEVCGAGRIHPVVRS